MASPDTGTDTQQLATGTDAPGAAGPGAADAQQPSTGTDALGAAGPAAADGVHGRPPPPTAAPSGHADIASPDTGAPGAANPAAADAQLPATGTDALVAAGPGAADAQLTAAAPPTGSSQDQRRPLPVRVQKVDLTDALAETQENTLITARNSAELLLRLSHLKGTLRRDDRGAIDVLLSIEAKLGTLGVVVGEAVGAIRRLARGGGTVGRGHGHDHGHDGDHGHGDDDDDDDGGDGYGGRGGGGKSQVRRKLDAPPGGKKQKAGRGKGKRRLTDEEIRKRREDFVQRQAEEARREREWSPLDHNEPMVLDSQRPGARRVAGARPPSAPDASTERRLPPPRTAAYAGSYQGDDLDPEGTEGAKPQKRRRSQVVNDEEASEDVTLVDAEEHDSDAMLQGSEEEDLGGQQASEPRDDDTDGTEHQHLTDTSFVLLNKPGNENLLRLGEQVQKQIDPVRRARVL
jgi:hypothetical protein